MIDLTPRPIEKYFLSFWANDEAVVIQSASFNALFSAAIKMVPSAQAVVRNQNGEVIYPMPEPVQVVKIYDPALPNVVVYEPLKTLAA